MLTETNKNLKDLIEVIRDFNFLLGKILGYKITYKESSEEKCETAKK